jgi:hypothetical protein
LFLLCCRLFDHFALPAKQLTGSQLANADTPGRVEFEETFEEVAE